MHKWPLQKGKNEKELQKNYYLFVWFVNHDGKIKQDFKMPFSSHNYSLQEEFQIKVFNNFKLPKLQLHGQLMPLQWLQEVKRLQPVLKEEYYVSSRRGNKEILVIGQENWYEPEIYILLLYLIV